MVSNSAPMTPADHVLASALLAVTLTRVHDPARLTMHVGILNDALARPRSQNAFCWDLADAAARIVSCAPGFSGPEWCRARLDASAACARWAEWRLGLALDKVATTKGAAA